MICGFTSRELHWHFHRMMSGVGVRQQLWRWQVAVGRWRWFWATYRRYSELAEGVGVKPRMQDIYPCLRDNTGETEIEPTYFFQDSWAFGHIVRERPMMHVDVGSHHTYVALLSLVVPVTMVDIRPLSVTLPSLTFKQGSILSLPYEDAALHSVSSLCVVEHIGLGRYGDPLDPLGTEKAISELKRVLAPGGVLYLSVPVDVETRVEFNAHRVFRESDLEKMFDGLDVVESRYVCGRTFGNTPPAGFGVGCYKLRRAYLR